MLNEWKKQIRLIESQIPKIKNAHTQAHLDVSWFNVHMCGWFGLWTQYTHTVFMQISLDQMNIYTSWVLSSYINVIIPYIVIWALNLKLIVQLKCCSLLLMAHLPRKRSRIRIYALSFSFSLSLSQSRGNTNGRAKDTHTRTHTLNGRHCGNAYKWCIFMRVCVFGIN